MTGDVTAIAASLADRLPATDVQRLSAAAAQGLAGLVELRASAANAALRDACNELAVGWRRAGQLPGGWVAGVVAGAGAAAARSSRSHTVEVVWTGPESDVDTGRLTAPTVAELIEGAAAEIWVVSFATHRDQRISDALERAVERNVGITLVVERQTDNPAYNASAMAFPDLDLRRLYWPGDRRPAGAALHAKLIVVDRTVALVGSANLTGRAMTDNLECGVLLRGGHQPAAIVAHLEGLVENGTLRSD